MSLVMHGGSEDDEDWREDKVESHSQLSANEDQ
jgi:hypothetical protein